MRIGERIVNWTLCTQRIYRLGHQMKNTQTIVSWTLCTQRIYRLGDQMKNTQRIVSWTLCTQRIYRLGHQMKNTQRIVRSTLAHGWCNKKLNRGTFGFDKTCGKLFWTSWSYMESLVIQFREEVHEIQTLLWSEEWLTLQLKDRTLRMSFVLRLSEVKRVFLVFAGSIRHLHKFFCCST